MTTLQPSPADLRAAAASHDQAAVESFDRCDTDGCLSQWSHGITAQLLRARASILEAGGTAEFAGLFDARGQRVPARIIPTQYGTCWLLRDDAAEQYGRRFVPTGKRSRVQRQLGLREAPETARAEARIVGAGTGLASCATARVVACRLDEWGV